MSRIHPTEEEIVAEYETQIKHHKESIHRVREEINRLREQRRSRKFANGLQKMTIEDWFRPLR